MPVCSARIAPANAATTIVTGSERTPALKAMSSS
jgi:hypothetical protein